MSLPDTTQVTDDVRSQGKRCYMMPQSGKGKELATYLRKELSIPEGVRWFEVRFAMDEIITVNCEYMPQVVGTQ